MNANGIDHGYNLPAIHGLSEPERTVIRAAWQVFRDLGYTLDAAIEFENRLVSQIDSWKLDDIQSRAQPDYAFSEGVA